MENVEITTETIQGQIKVILGGIRAAKTPNTGLKINKTGICIGLNLAEKCGLVENDYVSFGMIGDHYSLFFSKIYKSGFIKATKSQNVNFLNASLNGKEMKKEALKWIGIYTAFKKCSLEEDKSISVILFRKNDNN